MNSQKAIQVNDYAVELIEQGYIHEAQCILVKVLNSTQDMLNRIGKDNIPLQISLDETMIQTDSKTTSQDYEATSCSTMNQPLLNGYGERKTKPAGFLYRKPIRIPTTIGSTYKAGVVICAVILFNLALVHQLLQIEEQEQCMFMKDSSKSKLLCQKALRLYQLALTVFSQAEEEGSGLIFTMAVINNLGLLYQQLNDSATATKCFQRLLSTLLYITDSFDCPLFSDFDGFFENTSHLIFQKTTAAAA